MNSTNRSWLIAIISLLGVSACTNLPTRVHGSGVKIEPVSNETGTVRSAAFWTNSDGISLRGEVALPPTDEGLMTGHIDIAITVPDGSTTVCAVAPLIADRRYGDIVYAHRFVSLPPRGSAIRLWHHASADHQACAG